jgi:hypothetical protein
LRSGSQTSHERDYGHQRSESLEALPQVQAVHFLPPDFRVLLGFQRRSIGWNSTTTFQLNCPHYSCFSILALHFPLFIFATHGPRCRPATANQLRLTFPSWRHCTGIRAKPCNLRVLGCVLNLEPLRTSRNRRQVIRPLMRSPRVLLNPSFNGIGGLGVVDSRACRSVQNITADCPGRCGKALAATLVFSAESKPK